MDNAFRSIPSVHEILSDPQLAESSIQLPRARVVAAVRQVLAEHRRLIAAGSNDHPSSSVEKLAGQAAWQLKESEADRLDPIINATGIILHTGLGRAPLAREAVLAVERAAGNYVPLEVDLKTGLRENRLRVVRRLLGELTGGEAAAVVNNNAAALVLTLAAIAKDREVIVSRGELIEIGGGFRLPEIMSASGARLVEVGSTNKTNRRDYEAAIHSSTAAILKVHPSNYEQSGFVESVSLSVLAEIAKRHQIPFVHDIGSGLLLELKSYGLFGEPLPHESLDAGADLVLFSCDKLLGGPQGGVIAGKAELVKQIERHPLMRAMRIDKLNLAALAATLKLYREQKTALREVPVLAMMAAPHEEICSRAKVAEEKLSEIANLSVEAIDSIAYLGGGSLPRQKLASAAIKCKSEEISESELAFRLRTGTPPVMPRIQDGAVLLDLRTVFRSQDAALVNAMMRAVEAPFREPPIP